MLNQSPDAPVEAGNAAVNIHLVHELSGFLLLVHCLTRKLGVGSDVFPNEGKTLRFSRNGRVVAVVASPFGKVVRNIKSRRRWRAVLVVDEADSRFNISIPMNNDVGAE